MAAIIIMALPVAANLVSILIEHIKQHIKK